MKRKSPVLGGLAVFLLSHVLPVLAERSAPAILEKKGGAIARNTGDSGTFTDPRDGEVYKWVKIGDQIWMAENLRAARYRDGTPIPNVPDRGAWSKLTTGALCRGAKAPSTPKDVYGALYNFYAVVDSRKLSPVGWHVPTIEEWTILENQLGGQEVAGGKMKETASKMWKIEHFGANNESGFSAVPAGGRGRFGNPEDDGYFATWWSSNSQEVDFAWHWGLYPDKAAIRSNPGHKASGFSVRCVKDSK